MTYRVPCLTVVTDRGDAGPPGYRPRPLTRVAFGTLIKWQYKISFENQKYGQYLDIRINISLVREYGGGHFVIPIR